MPLLPGYSIKSPFWQFNGHLQTIIPNVTRKIEGVTYERERLQTWDHDFLDIDWSKIGSDTLVIITHGLAGNTQAAYMKALVRISNENHWDALAWNCRGCSGEPNKKIHTFHGGKTDDLDWVVQHAIQKNKYKNIYLVGVSMGGNQTLKLMGEYGEKAPSQIKKAVAISVPVDMLSTSYHLIKGMNKIYSNRYLKQYIQILQQKEPLFPGQWDYNHVYKANNLHVFVERYTAPSFGFKNAEEYLSSQSSIHYLNSIKVPTLLINADNDPFLTPSSYPLSQAQKSESFHLIITKNGGHVGFDEANPSNYNWAEQKAMEFFTS